MKHLFLSLLLLTLLFPFIKTPASADAQTPTLFFCVGTNAKPPCAQPPVSPSIGIANPASGGVSPVVSANPSGGPSAAQPSTTLSQTPSTNPAPSTSPCSTSQSSVSTKSTGAVSAMHFGKRHFSGGRGWLQQFFQFFLELLQLLFQQLGVQFPTNPCPTPSTAPSPSSGGNGNNPSNSPSSNPGNGNNPSPSAGAGNGNGNGGGNNPSPSAGAGNGNGNGNGGGNNNPSPSAGAGNGNGNGNGGNNSPSPSGGAGTKKDAFSAPKVTEKTALSGTTWVMTITWPPVTTTTQGNKASPTAYNLSFADSSGKTIHGMTNTSTHPVSDGKTDYCTSSLCTQTVTATSTKNSANTNGSDPITLLSSGKATVIISAAATSKILASANGTATVTKPATTAGACSATVPNVMGDTLSAAETTLKNAKFTVGVNSNSKSGNIISQSPGPGDKSSASCTEDIESDNLTATTACTSSSTSGRCTYSACTANQISGKGAPYCESNTVHHNGTGGYYYSGYCPGSSSFECWVPGATSAKSKSGTGGPAATCASLGGTCSSSNALTGGGYTVLNGTCPTSGQVCIKTDTSTYNSCTQAKAGNTCITSSQAKIYQGDTNVNVVHYGTQGGVNYDAVCAKYLSGGECWTVTDKTKTASVNNSAVAASTVNQTATAAPNLWTTITSGIWHVLTSL